MRLKIRMEKCRATAVLLAASLLVGVSCGSNGGSSPRAPTSPSGNARATLTLAMTPNPVVEDPTCACGGLPNRTAAIGRLTIRETAGVGVRIDGLRATGRQNTAGATTFTSDFTSADVAGHANGQSRVAASGTLDVIDVGGHYDRSLSGPAVMTVDVRGTDDSGNPITATLSVPVSPPAR